MIGLIGFENHRISCIIGIHDAERVEKQDIFVDLKVAVDISKCVSSDRVEDTVDYVSMALVCSNLAINNSYRLLERYAVDVLKALFDSFDIQEAWIKVKKPNGLPLADHSFVELSRKR